MKLISHFVATFVAVIDQLCSIFDSVRSIASQLAGSRALRASGEDERANCHRRLYPVTVDTILDATALQYAQSAHVLWLPQWGGRS